MSEVRDAICQEARTWVGTPYHDRACVKGENGGVDCAMLVAGIARTLKIITEETFNDIPVYPTQWHMHQDQSLLVPYLQSLGCQEKNAYEPGDIIVCRFGRVPSHLGVYVDNDDIIHAYRSPSINRVISIPFTNSIIEQRMTHIFCFPGVE